MPKNVQSMWVILPLGRLKRHLGKKVSPKMKTFHVACESAHGPSYEETVRADDPKSAKKLVAARAKEKGLNPTHFTAIEVATPKQAGA